MKTSVMMIDLSRTQILLPIQRAYPCETEATT